MPSGVVFSINGVGVTAPDEEVWTPISVGVALTGRQKRSPYYRLEWTKQVADDCRLDWFDYDDTTLTSLWTRPPSGLNEYAKYTDAICQSVVMRHRRGVGNEVIARFLVYVG
jgi:hypothetical protein